MKEAAEVILWMAANIPVWRTYAFIPLAGMAITGIGIAWTFFSENH